MFYELIKSYSRTVEYKLWLIGKDDNYLDDG